MGACIAMDCLLSVQAGRPIAVTPVEGLQMQRAILNPLSMGSRGRYVLVLGIQVWRLCKQMTFNAAEVQRLAGSQSVIRM